MEIINNIICIWVLLSFLSIPLIICRNDWSLVFANDIDFIDREGENIIIRFLLCLVVFLSLPFRIPTTIKVIFKQIVK
jgi:hypothetical protein